MASNTFLHRCSIGFSPGKSISRALRGRLGQHAGAETLAQTQHAKTCGGVIVVCRSRLSGGKRAIRANILGTLTATGVTPSFFIPRRRRQGFEGRIPEQLTGFYLPYRQIGWLAKI